MKLLIIANGKCAQWKSWDKKIESLKKEYAVSVPLQIDLMTSNFETIPYIQYFAEDNPNSPRYMEGIEPSWYDQNITPLAKGYDMVLFVMPVSQWNKTNGARGWRTDRNAGPVELHIWCDENETVYYSNFGTMPAFFQFARHEIAHALYMIKSIPDRTHYWWDLGKFENIHKDFNDRAALISLLTGLLNAYNEMIKIIMATKTKLQSLHDAAKGVIGQDASPSDLAPDELGCAESVSNIVRKVLPDFPIITGTWTLEQKLKTDKRFTRVLTPSKGTIVISATGTGNGKIAGHVGIFGDGVIMSNDSATGKFMPNFTLEGWTKRYKGIGGFPINYYDVVG